ncbi:hypothetical protein D3C80_1661790 [compost metagenome]
MLSWPTYFWYRIGIEANSRFSGSSLRMYQLETSSIPSGFSGANRMMVSFRTRRASGSSAVSHSCTAAIRAWGGTVSVECRPPSIQTTALPSADMARACSSVTPSALARRRAIS